MTDPMGALSGAMGAFFANAIVQGILYATFGYMILLWIVAAYWAFRDMRDRTENPVLPFLATGLIIMFLPFFFPLGIVVYRVVRPPERLGDVYERNLAEEALLAEVEAVRTCRGCDRRVDPEWIICPWCRQRLNRVCPNCERLVGLDWSLCAWCGKDFERPATEPVAERVPASSPAAAPAPAATAAPGSLRGAMTPAGSITPGKQIAGH
ncbi:MAG: zinc ribbon domain-containing protein [Candidatus Limnocylindrales bacterium]|jgi:RNA polymerase subunit RPABC4/transcription elongation factor Spt4